MIGADIVRAAIPGANDHLVDHIVWGRTSFPFGRVSARDLFKAAHRWRRSGAQGLTLCDFCDNLVAPSAWVCYRCRAALDAAAAAAD